MNEASAGLITQRCYPCLDFLFTFIVGLKSGEPIDNYFYSII